MMHDLPHLGPIETETKMDATLQTASAFIDFFVFDYEIIDIC